MLIKNRVIEYSGKISERGNVGLGRKSLEKAWGRQLRGQRQMRLLANERTKM